MKPCGCISQASPTLPPHVQAARRGDINRNEREEEAIAIE